MIVKQTLILFFLITLQQFSFSKSNCIAPQKELALTTKVNSVFSFFRIHRQTKNGIACTWGVTPGNNVTQFKILRTYGDPTDPYAVWDIVGVVASTGALRYKFLDASVFPGFISYKIVAEFNNNTSETSEILTLHILSH